MILIIYTNKDPLHFYEFVKPVGKILIKNKIKGFIRHYSCLTKKDLEKADKIIITGTSLQDDGYLEKLKEFEFIKNPEFKKPVLGICAGMQVLIKIFGGELYKNTEIGMNEIEFEKEFLGKKGKVQVYELHNLSIKKAPDFEAFSKNSKSIQAIKHKSKPLYGIIFHPEVRNEDFVLNFCEI